MNEEARKAAAAYARAWRKKNPEKVKATRERYWQKKAAQYSEPVEEEKHLLTFVIAFTFKSTRKCGISSGKLCQ